MYSEHLNKIDLLRFNFKVSKFRPNALEQYKKKHVAGVIFSNSFYTNWVKNAVKRYITMTLIQD